jgi:hypothetical protein
MKLDTKPPAGAKSGGEVGAKGKNARHDTAHGEGDRWRVKEAATKMTYGNFAR